MAIGANDSILVAGSFHHSNGGIQANHVARINEDGTADTTFNSNVGTILPAYDYAHDLVVDSKDRIVITGNFVNVDGKAVNGVARFDEDGTPDTDFNTEIAAIAGIGASPIGEGVAVDSSDNVIVTGMFNSVDGKNVHGLARFTHEGKADTSFNEAVADAGGIGSKGQDVLVLSDGSVMVTGAFASLPVDGVQVNRLARFKDDGTPHEDFNEAIAATGGLNGDGEVLIQDSEDRIVVGGSFTAAFGSPARHLARFGKDGTPDAPFNTAMSASGTEGAILGGAVDGEDRITVAGQFFNVQGPGGTNAVNHLARFNGIESAPGAPTITKITPGDEQLEVEFTAGSDGGLTITNYEYLTNGGTDWVPFDPVVTSSPVTLTEQSTAGSPQLVNGDTYQVVIRAVNSEGSGASSNTMPGTPVGPTPPTPTPPAPPTKPTSVKIPEITFKSLTRVDARVKAGSGISRIEFRTKAKGRSIYRAWQSVPAKARTGIPVNVRRGAWVQVRAIHQSGAKSKTVRTFIRVTGARVTTRGEIARCAPATVRSLSYTTSQRAQLRIGAPSVRCLAWRFTKPNSSKYVKWRKVSSRTLTTARLGSKTGKIQVRAGKRIATIWTYNPR